MKIIGFVCIKLNSERLPNKNIKLLNNKPLCTYIFNTLLKIKELDTIYVYCSDYKIMEYIENNEKIIFIKRDEKYDTNETTVNDLLISFSKLVNADYYIMCHTTSPFTNHKSIQSALNILFTGGYDSVFSVIKTQTFMWNINKIPLNFDINNIPRTQDLDPVYLENSGFYIFNRKDIIKGNRIGSNPYLYEVNNIESIDIDYEYDFKIAELVLSHF